MKNALIIFISFLLLSCTSDTKPHGESIHTGKTFKNEIDSTAFLCKEKLDSLGLEAAYDTCKFWLYCYNVNARVYFKNVQHPDSPTIFSTLSIDCGNVNILKDTIEFLFHINLKDSLSIDWGRTVTAHGVLYKLSENRPIGFILDGSMRYIWSSNPLSRANNPLQPDIIKFIQANYSLFNPWFVDRLKKRNIVK